MKINHYNALGQPINVGNIVSYSQYSNGIGQAVKGIVTELIEKDNYGKIDYKVKILAITGNRHYGYKPEEMNKINNNDVRNATFSNIYLLYPIAREYAEKDIDFQKLFNSKKYKKFKLILRKLKLEKIVEKK